MKTLFITPPMLQLNTPYPASSYLCGFLESQCFPWAQEDAAIDLALQVFSEAGLEAIYEEICHLKPEPTPQINFFMDNFEKYLSTVSLVVRFLQGKDSTAATRIANRRLLPEGVSFKALEDWEKLNDPNLESAFGTLGFQDKAKYLASLYLGDIATVVKEGVDSNFSLTRYGESLSLAVKSFTPIHESISTGDPTLIDDMLHFQTERYLATHNPSVVCLTVPFPGNFYGALSIARTVKQYDSNIKIVAGGGYFNTELRDLNDIRVFDYFDFVTLDDGEKPILDILHFLNSKDQKLQFTRTFINLNGKVKFFPKNSEAIDFSINDTGTPTYEGLDLGKYLSVTEMVNPMHRIWSDGRWNKLTIAHGCYWSRCSFCDTSLDYIERYEEAHVDTIIKRIEHLIAQTGETGFHFVDEAAPPKVLLKLAQKIIEKNIQISWWGNIRFEKSFNEKTCHILAESGCIAVTGGLEVASNRLLKLMDKGVTVEQVENVTAAFSKAGVLVHAYLMYGFPTQTEQEVFDSLEQVKKLFQNGYIQSAFWHRFAATVHSPVGKNPSKFGVTLQEHTEDQFCKNDILYYEENSTDFDRLGLGLKKAVYNFMHGIGFNEPLDYWFN